MTLRLIRPPPEVEQRLADDEEHAEALAQEDWGRLAGAIQRVVGRDLAYAPDRVESPHWGGYFAVDEASRTLVGSCAFKGPPAEEGIVEIAYFTYPEFEGRGYATEMAHHLVELAKRSADVQRVIAHTLRERNASTHVLRKVGMTFVGDVIEPEDGPVWRWELLLTADS